MHSKFVTLLLSFIVSTTVFSHGMNKHGPHGGFIRMPGAFHTELVDKGPKMHVYLLDMNFKKPMSENSSVTIKYKGKKELVLTCLKSSDHFVCDKPKDSLIHYNEITIDSVRNSNKARTAVYNLPLKLE